MPWTILVNMCLEIYFKTSLLDLMELKKKCDNVCVSFTKETKSKISVCLLLTLSVFHHHVETVADNKMKFCSAISVYLT